MSKITTILMIDDNPDDLELYGDLLSQCKSKYELLTTETAADGIKLYKERNIDCCLIDYNIPEKDGVEILDEIRSLSDTYKAIIILTGEPHQKIQAEAARKGALDYIQKSAYFSPDQLDSAIQKVINWASKLNEKGSAV